MFNTAPGLFSTVIAGLDPAIHAALPCIRRVSMDHRVKPGGDEYNFREAVR
jgi:hypothetical protein